METNKTVLAWKSELHKKLQVNIKIVQSSITMTLVWIFTYLSFFRLSILIMRSKDMLHQTNHSTWTSISSGIFDPIFGIVVYSKYFSVGMCMMQYGCMVWHFRSWCHRMKLIFRTSTVTDQLKPSWGSSEILTFMEFRAVSTSKTEHLDCQTLKWDSGGRVQMMMTLIQSELEFINQIIPSKQ